ncbi:hypothetical protein Tco_0790221 [Tanacetum coccineum]
MLWNSRRCKSLYDQTSCKRDAYNEFGEVGDLRGHYLPAHNVFKMKGAKGAKKADAKWWHWEEVEMEEVVVGEVWLEEESLVEFMVELFEEDEDGKSNEMDGLFNLKVSDQSGKA